MQKLKNFAQQGGADEVTQERVAIVGALSLYLDFINLFLLLLRLFGQSALDEAPGRGSPRRDDQHRADRAQQLVG